ncbi:MAG TPA: hypothetical protein VIB38_01845 [Aestuariivirgaceae bacterium]|jgi:hypothetical protein
MAKSRTKKATAGQKEGKAKKKRPAAGATAALTHALSDAKRSAAAKWAWVERQLKRA